MLRLHDSPSSPLTQWQVGIGRSVGRIFWKHVRTHALASSSLASSSLASGLAGCICRFGSTGYFPGGVDKLIQFFACVRHAMNVGPRDNGRSPIKGDHQR